MWHAQDGYAVRRIDWSEPDGEPRGSILFMPGRGDAYEKYLETLEHWRRQGWRVTAADWRGQAGSGRLGADAVTGHVDDFSIWVEDLAAFWLAWAAERDGPRVLAGHSMGGHLVLRAVADRVLDPRPDALVLSAPMLDTLPEAVPGGLKRVLAGVMSSLGDSRRPAWKWSEKPGEVPRDRQDLLTHDEGRYADELWWRTERPELVMGPGSWGWVAGALRSIAQLKRPGVLEGVEVPTFIVGTRMDRLVGTRAIQSAARRIPDCELLMLGSEARHEIFREVDPVRTLALEALDDFLEARLAQ